MSRTERPKAVVTGAASGIGAAACEALRGAGYEVVGLGRADLDVSDEAAVARVFAGLGEIDALVASAGVCEQAPLGSDDGLAVWRRVLATNLDGVFHCLTHARLRDGGRVVVISSGLGKVGRAGMAAYAASKHGVLGVVRCAALEWAPRGVTVNAVCPGWVDTKMARADVARSGRPRAEIDAQIPLGRFVAAEEVAALVAFLTSPAAAAITGQAYTISAGELQA